jgi:hypothetical protein
VWRKGTHLKKVCDDCGQAEAIVQITRANDNGKAQINLCASCFEINAADRIKGRGWTGDPAKKKG